MVGDEHDDRLDVTMVADAMRTWREAHPRATLTEIERELDRQLRAVRVALLSDVVGGAVARPDDMGMCPHCGGRLSRRGTHERTLSTDGDEALTLSRSYAWCPACESGLFPPG